MSVREMDLTPAEFGLTSEKMNKLNQRALKRGWTGIITVTGEAFTEITDNGVGLKRERQMVRTVISGNAPSYDGWTFLARADWSEGGMVLFTAPGIDGIDRSGITEGSCDHCGINRYRKSTFIVRSDKGEQLQVGSTCLKDFLGWNTNPVWIIPPSDNDLFGEGGFGHSTPVYSVDTILAAAWACIRGIRLCPFRRQWLDQEHGTCRTRPAHPGRKGVGQEDHAAYCGVRECRDDDP